MRSADRLVREENSDARFRCFPQLLRYPRHSFGLGHHRQSDCFNYTIIVLILQCLRVRRIGCSKCSTAGSSTCCDVVASAMPTAALCGEGSAGRRNHQTPNTEPQRITNHQRSSNIESTKAKCAPIGT